MVGLMSKSKVELRERIQRERNQREVIIIEYPLLAIIIID
jgi:hypothetical protein